MSQRTVPMRHERVCGLKFITSETDVNFRNRIFTSLQNFPARVHESQVSLNFRDVLICFKLESHGSVNETVKMLQAAESNLVYDEMKTFLSHRKTFVAMKSRNIVFREDEALRFEEKILSFNNSFLSSRTLQEKFILLF